MEKQLPSRLPRKAPTNVVICGRGEEALKAAAAESEKLGGNRF
ncbi:hypothetical protein P4595_21485 [Peribacillus frigoritolerans]|nr:hypothetical protein [Peribacillus frigoritolerans]MCR8871776.1 hypothetical protein [Peribacillus frigoritolerans]MED3835358.1 hypothetical protein [Peribacillus frigoritolerans]MED3848627.1 hypothetical protein [Peribacillus frigoritolerans]